jgi:DNA-binding Lrp family transcriptional regulator
MAGQLFAVIDIFVESQQMDDVIDSLSKLEGLQELYETTGEFDLMIVVSVSDIEELGDLLKNRIMKLNGIKSTASSIVLKACKGPKCPEDKFTPQPRQNQQTLTCPV